MNATDPWALAHANPEEVGMDAQQQAAAAISPTDRRNPMPDTEPLAVLANRYLDRRREFERHSRTSSEVSSFNDAQEELLEQMEETPAITLDDVIAKLEVIRCELWDDAGSNEEQYHAADRLTLTLADDLRRVIGQTTAYRFEPRLWVEAAIRAGMDPRATLLFVPADKRRSFAVKERRLGLAVAVHRAYEPPMLDKAQVGAVIDELVRRSRVDVHYEHRPALDAAK